MKKINLQNHKLISFILLFGWIFLSGFSIFPLEVFPLYYPKLFIAISWYGLISIWFTWFWSKGHNLRVFILTFTFTVLGLLCRYLFNYGEISNSKDFTIVNILMYIIIVPLSCTSIYWIINKWRNIKK